MPQNLAPKIHRKLFSYMDFIIGISPSKYTRSQLVARLLAASDQACLLSANKLYTIWLYCVECPQYSIRPEALASLK